MSIKTKTWASRNRWLQGERPITLNEKLAIAFIAGATAFITAERIGWWLSGNLKVWF